MTVELRPISIEIIRECYNSDRKLLKYWHDSTHDTYEKCVQDCHKDLKALGDNFKFFVIKDGNNTVGFFGTNKNILETFFIHQNYRNSKPAVWKIIKSEFNGEPFFAGLHTTNKRAAIFFVQNGGELLSTAVNANGHEGWVFRFKE